MVLESLLTPNKAERKPWEMLFLGLMYTSIAIFLSLWIFKEESSLIMVFLTVLACVPLVYNMLKLEEQKDLKNIKEIKLLKEHWKALSFLMYLFFGFIIAFSIWYVILPPYIIKTLFSTQIQTIDIINAQLHGVPINTQMMTGNLHGFQLFSQILSNNLKVFLFCIFFSFFYGAGAIFILTWNASVIATAVGSFIREHISSIFGVSYFSLFSIGIMRYMTHGFFEILAYFIGGLAGGIISMAVIRHDVQTRRFRKVLTDSFNLIIIAIGLLVIAALIEIYVTPMIF